MAIRKNGPGLVGGVCTFLLAVLTTIGDAAATSANTDLSDIWWNPAESGWGMQIVNTGTFAFVTIYHYGTDGKPVWFGGGLNRPAVSGAFTGDLYATTGPYYGGSFNPTTVTARKVGTLTFLPTSVSTAQFTYSVDGVVVNKMIERQPLTLDNYNGSFRGTMTQTAAYCLINPARNGKTTADQVTDIVHNGNAISIVISRADSSVVCTFDGTYTQFGRMGQVRSSYTCSDGEFGTANFIEMNIVPFMLTTKFQSQSINRGCVVEGEIVGVIPR